MKIIETVESSRPSQAERLRAILAKHGVRHLDDAIRDNPDGPVRMITTRYATQIDYQVIVGDDDMYRGRCIWDRSVTFGATDRTVAGGEDFVAAARAQDEVAQAAHALLEALAGDGGS